MSERLRGKCGPEFMTAIAAILRGGSQVLVGDLMLSKPGVEYDSDEILLPTGRVSSKEIGPIGPSGFVQKLVVINPNLVLGWAGSLTFGSWASRFLRENFESKREFDESDLEAIYEKLSAECTDRSAFLVSTFQPETGELRLKQFGGWWGHIEGVCDMMVAGSGATHLYEAAERLNEVPDSCVAQWAMALVATMIEREVASGSSTLENYGGGWEIVHLTPRGFEKISPMLFSQWLIEPIGDTYSYEIECVIGSKYFGERLSVKSLVQKNKDEVAFMFNDAWPPDLALRGVEAPGPANFELDSKFQVFAVRMDDGQKPCPVSYRIGFGIEQRMRPFRETAPGLRSLEYKINLKVLDEIYSELKKMRL